MDLSFKALQQDSDYVYLNEINAYQVTRMRNGKIQILSTYCQQQSYNQN